VLPSYVSIISWSSSMTTETACSNTVWTAQRATISNQPLLKQRIQREKGWETKNAKEDVYEWFDVFRTNLVKSWVFPVLTQRLFRGDDSGRFWVNSIDSYLPIWTCLVTCDMVRPPEYLSEYQMRKDSNASHSVTFNIKMKKKTVLLWCSLRTSSLQIDPRTANWNAIIFYVGVTRNRMVGTAYRPRIIWYTGRNRWKVHEEWLLISTSPFGKIIQPLFHWKYFVRFFDHEVPLSTNDFARRHSLCRLLHHPLNFPFHPSPEFSN